MLCPLGLSVKYVTLGIRGVDVIDPEIAPEPTGHGLPLSKCEAYNHVCEQFYGCRLVVEGR